MSTPSGDGADERRGDQTAMRRLLEIGVLAPLGFLLEYRTVLPKLTEAGRRQVDFTRSLGRAALRTIARGTASNRSSRSGSIGGTTTTTGVTEVGSTATPAPVGSTADAGPSNAAGDVDGSSPAAAIAGYSEMSARDVVALVAASDLERVEWIAETEAAGKARVTVLRAATARQARLQGER